MIKETLETRFRLALIVFSGTFAALVIAPFAVFRAFEGDLMHASIDAALVLLIGLSVCFALVSGKDRLVGHFLAVVCLLGATVTAVNLGFEGLVWLYPAIIASILISSIGFGITLSMIAVAITLTASAEHFSSWIQMVSAMVTYGVVITFTALTAWLFHYQSARLKDLVAHDPLTRTLNRYSLDGVIEGSIDRVRHHQGQVSVLMIDLDHFKYINDNFGHKAGDDAIIECAQVISRHCRSMDRVCRYGGEEFIVLLDDCPGANGVAIAERIREAIKSTIKIQGRVVTTSIGVTALSVDDSNRSVIERADALLYQAKESGRDRVCSDVLPDDSELDH